MVTCPLSVSRTSTGELYARLLYAAIRPCRLPCRSMHAAEPGTTRLVFAGLGLMCLPMARNSLTACYELTVWNRTAASAAPLVAEGAARASDTADVARGDDVIVTIVTASPN